MKQLLVRLSAAVFLLPGVALAHTGSGESASLMHGLSHPLSGIDHMLAMLAVGIWAAQKGGRGQWLLPSTFVLAMLAGGLLGFTGVALPFVEQGILLSVLLSGLLITGVFNLPLAACSALTAVFAIFHGHAHGAEMPMTASAISYTVGFVLATAALHVTGFAVGKLLQNAGHLANRVAGATVALAGIVMAIA